MIIMETVPVLLVITFSLEEFFTAAHDKSNVMWYWLFLVTQNGYSRPPWRWACNLWITCKSPQTGQGDPGRFLTNRWELHHRSCGCCCWCRGWCTLTLSLTSCVHSYCMMSTQAETTSKPNPTAIIEYSMQSRTSKRDFYLDPSLFRADRHLNWTPSAQNTRKSARQRTPGLCGRKL